MPASTTKVKNERAKAAHGGCHEPKHPDHASEITRLKRIRGQVEGIERMIGDRRYCMDILQQIKAARSALQSLEASVLKTHLKGCVREALQAKDAFDAGRKIDEITDLLTK